MTDVVEIKDMSQLITAMGGAVKLDDMTDVTLSTPSSGQVLEYNGTKWANASISEVPDTTGATAGDLLTLGADGAAWIAPAGLWVPVPEAAEAGYVLTAKADGTVEWVDPTAEVTSSKKKKV